MKTNKSLNIIRFVQAVFAGIFTLGVAFLFGDYTEMKKSWISSIAITCLVFGFAGVAISEFMARKLAKLAKE